MGQHGQAAKKSTPLPRTSLNLQHYNLKHYNIITFNIITFILTSLNLEHYNFQLLLPFVEQNCTSSIRTIPKLIFATLEEEKQNLGSSTPPAAHHRKFYRIDDIRNFLLFKWFTELFKISNSIRWKHLKPFFCVLEINFIHCLLRKF